MVIQGHRSWYHSNARMRLSITYILFRTLSKLLQIIAQICVSTGVPLCLTLAWGEPLRATKVWPQETRNKALSCTKNSLLLLRGDILARDHQYKVMQEHCTNKLP